MMRVPVINQTLQPAVFPSQTDALLVYMSAHWCPPCRGFTPLLKKFYSMAKDAGAGLEIVFLSSDRSEKEMIAYYQESHGEWLAVPFFAPQRQSFSSNFKVSGIPALLLVNRGTNKPVEGLDLRGLVHQCAMMGSKDRVKQIVDEWRQHSGASLFDSIPRSVCKLNQTEREGVFNLLSKIVGNIAAHPTEPKFRQLKGENAILKKAILDLPCGSSPLVAVGFQEDTSLKTYTFGPNFCDVETIKSIIDDRLSNGLVDLSTGGAASNVAVKYRILFRDMKPQVTDLIPLTEPLGVVKAIIESVTDIPSEHQRVFCPSLIEGAIEGHQAEETFLSLLLTTQSPVVDLLIFSQHTRVNKYSSFESSDEEANRSAMALREKIKELKLSPAISQILNYLMHVQIHEVPSHQLKALEVVPVMELHKSACFPATENNYYEENLFLQLVQWFKRRFFKWMDKPPCNECGNPETILVNSAAPPTTLELKGLASRTELYTCKNCGLETRFPRFNHPVALLASKTGRCGEWANCFTLIARSMGFEMRKVHDSADHVWTEVWMEHRNEWVHCDPCEEAYDKPLLYEEGWGKAASFTVAVSKESVVNVTRRYTRKEMQDVEMGGIKNANEIAMTHWAGISSDPARLGYLKKRAEEEYISINEIKSKNMEILTGRTTGSIEWRKQRGELGNPSPQLIIVSEPLGKSHKDTEYFSDEKFFLSLVEEDDSFFISKISLWSDGKFLAGISTEWTCKSGGTIINDNAAGSSPPDCVLSLGPDERISHITVKAADMVEFICIKTSTGQTVNAGNTQQTYVVDDSSKVSDKFQIVGFHGGKSSNQIHRLGLISRPVSIAQRIKHIFAELVAQGESPNDAALKALEISRSSQ